MVGVLVAIWWYIGSCSQEDVIDNYVGSLESSAATEVVEMNKIKVQITKFTVVGAANFVLTFIVFTVMLKILAINYLLSLIVAWIFGLIFSYALNFSWVFNPNEKFEFKARFLRFFFASFLSIALNMITLDYIVQRSNFDPFYVQVLIMPFVVIFNFLTAKFWSLRV